MSLEGRKRAEQAAARKDLPRLEEILRAERLPNKESLEEADVPQRDPEGW